jgi:hypothetical protein
MIKAALESKGFKIKMVEWSKFKKGYLNKKIIIPLESYKKENKVICCSRRKCAQWP